MYGGIVPGQDFTILPPHPFLYTPQKPTLCNSWLGELVSYFISILTPPRKLCTPLGHVTATRAGHRAGRSELFNVKLARVKLVEGSSLKCLPPKVKNKLAAFRFFSSSSFFFFLSAFQFSFLFLAAIHLNRTMNATWTVRGTSGVLSGRPGLCCQRPAGTSLGPKHLSGGWPQSTVSLTLTDSLSSVMLSHISCTHICQWRERTGLTSRENTWKSRDKEKSRRKMENYVTALTFGIFMLSKRHFFAWWLINSAGALLFKKKEEKKKCVL